MNSAAEAKHTNASNRCVFHQVLAFFFTDELTN